MKTRRKSDQKAKQLSPQQQACLAAHQAGLRPSEMARKLGISRQRVSQICQAIGIKPRTLRDIAKKRMKDIQRLLDKGKNTKEIAVHLNLDPRVVAGYRRQLGRPMRSITEARRHKVAALTQQGIKACKISTMLEVSYAMVVSDRKALGIGHCVASRTADGAMRRLQVAKLHNKGLTQKAIAEALGVAEWAIYIDMMVLFPSRAALDDRKRAEVERLALEGIGNTEIVKRTGTRMDQVCIVIQRLKDQGKIPHGRRKTVHA